MENCAFAVDPSDFVNNIVNVGTYVPGPPIKIMATIPRKHKLVKAGAWCIIQTSLFRSNMSTIQTNPPIWQ